MTFVFIFLNYFSENNLGINLDESYGDFLYKR